MRIPYSTLKFGHTFTSSATLCRRQPEIFTGSGNLDLNSYEYGTNSAIDQWNHWVLQSDLDSELSRIFFNGVLANEYFGITR